MLSKDEYRIVLHKGRKIVLCERIDMLGGIEEELLQGTLYAYKCPSEKEYAYKWKKLYEDFTKRPYTIAGSILRNGTQTVFSARLGCVHRRACRYRKNNASSKRDLNCPAVLRLFIRVPESSRSKNPTRGGYNLRVHSNREAHNHPHEMALQYRPLAEETKAMLLELFDQHHTPTSALEELKLRLLQRLGDDYFAEAADHAVVPSMGRVLKVFYETYHQRYGSLKRKQVRQLQQDAAKKRRLLAMMPQSVPPARPPDQEVKVEPPEQGEGRIESDEEQKYDPGERGEQVKQAEQKEQESTLNCEQGEQEEEEKGDLTESFDDGDALASSWLEAQTSPDHRAVTACSLSAEGTAVDRADARGSLPETEGPESRVENVVVCYMDDDAVVGSELLVESTEGDGAGGTEGIGGELGDSAGGQNNEAAATEAGVDGASPRKDDGADALVLSLRGILDSSPTPPDQPPSPAVPPPSAPTLALEVTRWASSLARLLSGDDGEQWRSAAAAFLERWRLLPAPGQLTALRRFGRGSGPGRPASCGRRPTETAATQTWTDGEEARDEESERTGPYFRSLCVLRSRPQAASVLARPGLRVASILDRV